MRWKSKKYAIQKVIKGQKANWDKTITYFKLNIELDHMKHMDDLVSYVVTIVVIVFLSILELNGNYAKTLLMLWTWDFFCQQRINSSKSSSCNLAMAIAIDVVWLLHVTYCQFSYVVDKCKFHGRLYYMQWCEDLTLCHGLNLEFWNDLLN